MMPPIPSRPDRRQNDEPRVFPGRLGLNLADLDYVNRALFDKAVRGKLALQEIVWFDRKARDGALVAFDKRVPLKTAALACDLLRADDRREGRPPTRVYRRGGGRWVMIPRDTPLTVVAGPGGSAVLNPEVFKEGRVHVAEAPPQRKASFLD